MKRIAILGSTGSIGKSALDVARHLKGKIRISALSTNSNIDILEKQVREFRPELVCVSDFSAAKKLKPRLKKGIRLLAGEEGLRELVQDKKINEVLLAISGSPALPPLLEAIESGKGIALANKEALVMAGHIIMKMAMKKKVRVIPIDSEQSAIWQCLEGRDSRTLKNIYLTASGGPFWAMRRKGLRNVSVSRVLKHPRWKMGRKVTVDSASLMNKGLEVIEAMFLFNTPSDKIKTLIHPEAIVHSMVEFIDGVILAQLSATDMRIPIQYALTYPQRLTNSLTPIDFYKLKELHFEKPDFRSFPCLRLAYRAASQLGTMPCVLNAANEVSVEEFLAGRLGFICIPKVIERVLDSHRNISNPGLRDIREADAWARREARRVIGNLN